MNTQYNQDSLLTLSEVASILKIGRAKVYSLPKESPNFPAIKIGRQYRVFYSDLMKWLHSIK